ncbi:hypothetical protein H0H81_005598 [Sphagnurus paluster]|uniref:Oxidation resistance protein 1 n=1 Tax=Sphagnurus paluster TaxID=117069 RepID=A0A9P7K5I1_9AGAR|nr:hypothetical protein H0H81_005598 [Sphagnurus paluster]
MAPSRPISSGSFVSVGDKDLTHEAMEDKFATLFSPATPRASPTPESMSGKYGPIPARPLPRPRSVRRDTSDSDFGDFVSVSASEDPLGSFEFEEATAAVADRSSKGSNFFDKFAQDAKAAADRNKHNVLDELLMHEDDPLYWLKDEGKIGGDDTTIQPDKSSPPDLTGAPEIPLSDPSSPLNDLDHDFFTTKPSSNTLNEPRPHHPHRNTTRPDHSPTRSSTLALPATLAPPLADTSIATPTPSEPISDPLSSTVPRPIPQHSYSTLGTFSSRWMASLLPSSAKSPPRPTLDSLFSEPAPQQKARHAHSTSRPASPPPPGSQFRAISLPPGHAHPHAHQHQHAHTAPSVKDVHISHGTPFAAPFAPHVFTPPTGAPGYAGEAYDWDKGYSEELERDLQVGAHGEREREMIKVGVGVGGGSRGSVVGKPKDAAMAKQLARDSLDVGLLIEQRLGKVELCERKASTTPVLSDELLRPHLPALARLPRRWTLVYSLDQHGISLNTLYTRSEAYTQVRLGTPAPAGALLVIRDAGDGLFGVWMGKDGVRPSRGKGYYGSGESFLWKYTPTSGELKVFKWTGRNDYIALCEPEFISFGGGDGNYGLYLDEALCDGSSAPCPTFANEPLCSPAPSPGMVVPFECVGLEVWGVGP